MLLLHLYLALPLGVAILEFHLDLWHRRLDTIRYSRFTCAQKLTRWPAQSSTWHRHEKIRNNYKQKPSSREETVRAIVREGSLGVL